MDTEAVFRKYTLVVCDFDGVFTDIGDTSAVQGPYLRHYIQHLATLLALTEEEAEEELQAYLRLVEDRSQEYGWEFGEFIVAPATCDPYVHVRTAATVMLNNRQHFPDTAARDTWQEMVFRTFERHPIPMKSRAPALLALLALHPRVAIVSNSSTEPVRGRLEGLLRDLEAGDSRYQEILDAAAPACDEGDNVGAELAGLIRPLIERVVGGARKAEISPLLQVVEEELRLPGLERPVLLHRGHYYQVLDALRHEAEVPWSEVVVIGDNFELDLALPLALGADVVLVDNGTVPSWERDFLEDHPRARVVEDLSEILGILRTSV